MVQLDLANHDHSEYKYVHTQYDNSMDVALCAARVAGDPSAGG